MLDTIQHHTLHAWLEEMIALCNPERVVVCDGSEAEYRILCNEMVKQGTLISLDPVKRPGCFLARSHPQDVARMEERTFICCERALDAGPTNQWVAPQEMMERLHQLFSHCMHGRTLYVIPFSMGPLGHSASRIGVQITDSPYAVISMRIMTRMGKEVLDVLEEDRPFVRCIHSVGVPLRVGQKDMPWPCCPEKAVIAHFPQEPSVWSFGSGYGGNALMGKKCFALRIASVLGRQEGWLAEHMLILGLTSPEGKKKYIAAAFPSACGKTNLAMLTSALPGWKVECVGDDIAWMHIGSDGRLYAMNPENGFFGVAPGTSWTSNPHAMETCRRNTLFTNVALTPDGDVWWEGAGPPPAHAINWKQQAWTPQSVELAAHPNARFTAPASQCPVIDPQWEESVPISAILFGGRRSTTQPLVVEARDWTHGVFMGACMSSERTAAAQGVIGELRHDPFAMTPFCGYHMGDYFQHWLDMGQRISPSKQPKIFSINWFRKGQDGTYLWPGFGDNIRVLEWIFRRVDDVVPADETPIGKTPRPGDLDLHGLTIPLPRLRELLRVDRVSWQTEVEELRRYLTSFGDHLPHELREQLERVAKEL